MLNRSHASYRANKLLKKAIRGATGAREKCAVRGKKLSVSLNEVLEPSKSIIQVFKSYTGIIYFWMYENALGETGAKDVLFQTKILWEKNREGPYMSLPLFWTHTPTNSILLLCSLNTLYFNRHSYERSLPSFIIIIFLNSTRMRRKWRNELIRKSVFTIPWHNPLRSAPLPPNKLLDLNRSQHTPRYTSNSYVSVYFEWALH